MISLIEEKDIENVYKLGVELHPNFKKLYNYNSLVNNIDKTYKIEENNNFVGFIHIQLVSDETNIIDIVVNNSYRGKGYGKMLLDYVFNKYKDTRFILEVSSNNLNAINFYNNNGFIVINIRNNYYQDGSDALIMEKK